MRSVTIYTKDWCSYCVRAKALFKSLGADFSEINLENDPEQRQAVSDRYHWRTMPMIVVGDQFLGGFDDVVALHRKGQLVPLLQGTSQPT